MFINLISVYKVKYQWNKMKEQDNRYFAVLLIEYFISISEQMIKYQGYIFFKSFFLKKRTNLHICYTCYSFHFADHLRVISEIVNFLFVNLDSFVINEIRWKNKIIDILQFYLLNILFLFQNKWSSTKVIY
jgi:hypothetical protein